MRSPTYVFLLLAAVTLVAVLGLVAVRSFEGRSVTYSELREMVAKGEIETVTFQGARIEAVRTEAAAGDGRRSVQAVAVPDDDSLIQSLREKNVPYGAVQAPGCGGPNVLLALAMMGAIWFFMARPPGQVPPGATSFARSQARLAPEEGTGVTFADVAGIDEAEEELQEIVQFLKTPERFTRLGGKIPKGVLLVGPPGTGKTLLARAVAGEAGVPFFSISGSDFVELFVGVGAARVRDLFKQASERAPCIIFIDEIDAVGKSRGAMGPVGGHDEREQTLNQLLVEMDGFDGRKGIILLAATNRPETLDAALLRAGRFDRQVMVDRPDVRGREAILKVHARSMRLAEGADLKVVAQRTPGFTGADLANALNEAALLAARHGKDAIGMEELDEAVERAALGKERKSRRLSLEERRATAVHEAGHAVCAAATPGAYPVSKVSIIPRGFTGGVTRFVAPEDRISAARGELLAQLVVAYGGMAAEEAFLADVTTGARGDIIQASDLARKMVTEYGMSERLGAINYGSARPNPFGLGPAERDVPISEDTARAIDAEVRRILDAARDSARGIVRAHRELIQEMADALLESEVLDAERLGGLLARVEQVRPLETLKEAVPA